MTTDAVRPTPIARPAAGATPPGPGAPSPEALQRTVDEAAYLNLASYADADGRDVAIRGGGGVIGVEVGEVLRRFVVSTRPPDVRAPLRASNAAGEIVGRFRHRWMIAPDDFVAVPNVVPPPTAWDPRRSQRFVMLDSECTFGDGGDGFRGFGTGQTFPDSTGAGGRALATGVGTILGGWGKFAGLDQGTYVYCGTLSPRDGFRGNLMVRVIDPRGGLQAKDALPPLRSHGGPEPGITYVVLRGEAVPSDPVRPFIGPDGRQIGLIVQQGLKLEDLDTTARGAGGLRASVRVGEPIGRITAYVTFNPALARGTALDPVPFTAYDEFEFVDSDGQPIGGFAADSSEGRVFNIAVSGQPAIRFGGVGRIRGGTGPFRGMQGLMTDNSVVVFSPHVSASVYVLRVDDSRGFFRGRRAAGDADGES